MANKHLDVWIKKDGHVEIAAIGYSGPACTAATKEIEQALGTTISSERTADYWKKPTTETHAEQRA